MAKKTKDNIGIALRLFRPVLRLGGKLPVLGVELRPQVAVVPAVEQLVEVGAEVPGLLVGQAFDEGPAVLDAVFRGEALQVPPGLPGEYELLVQPDEREAVEFFHQLLVQFGLQAPHLQDGQGPAAELANPRRDGGDELEGGVGVSGLLSSVLQGELYRQAQPSCDW